MGDTTTSYVPRDYRRVCDQCGLLFQRSRLHRKLHWVLCDICDQPGDRIREQEDAAIARQRPFRILPVPNAKPLSVDSPYDWQAEEAQVFDFVALTAPSDVPGGASDVPAAAAAAAYMAEIIIEGRRPAVWLSTARTVLDRCLAYLISVQYGGGISATIDNTCYGGFLLSGTFPASYSIAAGRAFIKGYTATGDWSYLSGARRCATFVRHAQCRDLQTPYTTYPSAGTAYHVGGVSATVANATGLLSSRYNLTDVRAAEFLEEIGAAIGMDAMFGDAASTSYFTAATQATLETMISELVAFAVTGAKDANHDGDYITGLSTTQARNYYTAASSDGSSGAGVWDTPSSVFSSVIASALAGVYAVNGADDTVTAILAWLAAFTSNAANRTPSTNTEAQTLAGITGTYDPAVCPASSLQAAAPFTEATGATYDLATLGLLAPILSVTDPTRFRSSRATVSAGERWSTFDLSLRYLGLSGLGGLSLQPLSPYQTFVSAAATFGSVYRYVNP